MPPTREYNRLPTPDGGQKGRGWHGRVIKAGVGQVGRGLGKGRAVRNLCLAPEYRGRESARAAYLPPRRAAGRRLAGLGVVATLHRGDVMRATIQVSPRRQPALREPVGVVPNLIRSPAS